MEDYGRNITLEFSSFQSLGTVFRDIVVSQHSLWVICEALDAIFDTFADGPLVNAAADSIGLLVNLQQLAAVLKSRVSVTVVNGRLGPNSRVNRQFGGGNYTCRVLISLFSY